MLITTFTSKATKGLLPLSPYDDLTFDFKTYSVNNLKSIRRTFYNTYLKNPNFDYFSSCKIEDMSYLFGIYKKFNLKKLTYYVFI